MTQALEDMRNAMKDGVWIETPDWTSKHEESETTELNDDEEPEIIAVDCEMVSLL